MTAALSGAHGETLAEALAMAYRNNPNIEAQRAFLRATDEGVAQALSGWRPRVQLDATGGRALRERNFSREFDAEDDNGNSDNRYSAGFTITQPLYSGGRTVADTERAESVVQAERARLDQREQNVLLAATNAYMNVLRDQAVLDLNVNNERVLRRQLQATRDRFEVGEVTRTDVAQAESRLALAIADRTQAEGNLETSRANYQQIIGKLPENLQWPGSPPNLPESQEGAITIARQDNPAVLATFYDERASRNQVRVVTGELLPTVDLVGDARRQRNLTTADTTVDSLSLTAELTVPIYQQGAVSSRVREAKQLVGRNRMLLQQARREAIEAAKSAWERLVSTRARIESLEAQVHAADIALEGVNQEAAVGSRTVLDVLDAEQELLDAKVNLVRSQRDEIVASYDLLSAIGRLTGRELGLPVDYYDPGAHYNEVRDKIWGLGGEIKYEEPTLR